jgi:tetratricopeptide (TPR) repeat protein
LKLFLRFALLIAGMAALCVYAGFCARALYAYWLAQEAARRPVLEELMPDGQPALDRVVAQRTRERDYRERAVRVEPRNAAYQDQLGHYWLFVGQDPAAAVAACRRATELNPNDSRLWLDLAHAYLAAGMESGQESAIRQAIRADPTTPDVAWEAGNFFLLQQRITDALDQFKVVLQNDPSKVTPTLDRCWHALHNVDQIQEIMPGEPAVYLQFIQLLDSAEEPDAARRVWTALMQLRRNFDFRQALFHVDYLLSRRDVPAAVTAWMELAARSKDLQAYIVAGDAITDGAFAQPFLDASTGTGVGFGWRQAARPDVTVVPDTAEFRYGKRSLKFTWAGTADDTGVYQLAPVEPNTRYTLSAWVKSEDLHSAYGPRLIAADGYDHTVLAMSDETSGTTFWRRVSATFQTGPNLRLVSVSFGRNAPGTQAQGQFWIDSVSLRPTATLEGSSSSE